MGLHPIVLVAVTGGTPHLLQEPPCQAMTVLDGVFHLIDDVQFWLGIRYV